MLDRFVGKEWALQILQQTPNRGWVSKPSSGGLQMLKAAIDPALNGGSDVRPNKLAVLVRVNKLLVKSIERRRVHKKRAEDRRPAQNLLGAGR